MLLLAPQLPKRRTLPLGISQWWSDLRVRQCVSRVWPNQNVDARRRRRRRRRRKRHGAPWVRCNGSTKSTMHSVVELGLHQSWLCMVRTTHTLRFHADPGRHPALGLAAASAPRCPSPAPDPTVAHRYAPGRDNPSRQAKASYRPGDRQFSRLLTSCPHHPAAATSTPGGTPRAGMAGIAQHDGWSWSSYSNAFDVTVAALRVFHEKYSHMNVPGNFVVGQKRSIETCRITCCQAWRSECGWARK
jgi:hypothetical protein